MAQLPKRLSFDLLNSCSAYPKGLGVANFLERLVLKETLLNDYLLTGRECRQHLCNAVAKFNRIIVVTRGR